MKADLETVAQLTRELPHLSPYAVVQLYRKLRRDAATCQRYAVEACNRELTEAEERRWLNATNRILKAWDTACGLTVQTSGDPRGYVVKLILPSGASNNMGGEGWGIA